MNELEEERIRITFTVAFNIGEQVYLIHDEDQHVKQVTGYVFRDKQLAYIISGTSLYYEATEVELSKEKNIRQI